MRKSACLAMDVGGTNLRMAVITKDGAILTRVQSNCRISEGLDSFLADISSGYERMLKYIEESGISMVAVGAGIPGLTDKSGTVISSVNLKPLDGFNLQKWLMARTARPVAILNDANAAGVAEHAYGAGRPFGSFLHFTLGTGVGSALILDGRLWTGVDGFASEYGHATVEPDGLSCNCGNHGCLEQYSSATAITIMAKKGILNGTESSLSQFSFEAINSSDVYAAAITGDSLAIECIETAGRYLGIASATAVNMLNLEAIIVGGGVAASFDLLEPVMRGEIDSRAFPLPASRVKLLKSELDDNAGILGAAAAAWKLAKN
jgi:glucokinase